jgi:hypothetical protein
MDDRILEKMMTRAFRQVKSAPALALSALVLFCAAFLWVVMKQALFAITGSFHLPLLIVVVAMSLIPVSGVIVALSSRYLQVRLRGEERGFLDIFRMQIKPTAILFIYACGVCGVLVLLAVLAAVWCGIESIPALGAVVYFFFSWFPSFITILMGSLAVFHVLTILFLGAHMARVGAVEDVVLRQAILRIWTLKWVTRLKIVFIGLIPLSVFCLFSSPWVLKSLPLSVELCATVVRTLVLSLLASPFFLFAVHMSVEADRYVSKDS